MKKIIAILVILSCFVAFVSCGKQPSEQDIEKIESEVLETAETYVEVTGSSGSISLDESVAKTLLSVYPKKIMGLSKDIEDYDLKLSATRFANTDACLVEAFLDGAEAPEGTFVILGQQCFVYNKKSQKYLLLTLEGAVEFSSTGDETKEESTTEPAFRYDKEGNSKLHEKFAPYSKETLGLEKELSKYILVASGTTTTAENGEMVFVIRLYEKNGETTNNTLAFNENGNYVFDYEINKYKKLSY